MDLIYLQSRVKVANPRKTMAYVYCGIVTVIWYPQRYVHNHWTSGEVVPQVPIYQGLR